MAKTTRKRTKRNGEAIKPLNDNKIDHEKMMAQKRKSSTKGKFAKRDHPQMNKYGLNLRQYKFFLSYVRYFDAVRAYKDAGYKGKADPGAYLLLRKSIMKRALRMWSEAEEKQAKIDKAAILEELGRIALFDIRKFFNSDGTLLDIVDLEDREASAVSSIDLATTKAIVNKEGEILVPRATYVRSIRLWNKENALVQYGKHLGMFLPDSIRETAPEKMADEIRDIQLAMVQTLPKDEAKIIQGHFKVQESN